MERPCPLNLTKRFNQRPSSTAPMLAQRPLPACMRKVRQPSEARRGLPERCRSGRHPRGSLCDRPVRGQPGTPQNDGRDYPRNAHRHRLCGRHRPVLAVPEIPVPDVSRAGVIGFGNSDDGRGADADHRGASYHIGYVRLVTGYHQVLFTVPGKPDPAPLQFVDDALPVAVQ